MWCRALISSILCPVRPAVITMGVSGLFYSVIGSSPIIHLLVDTVPSRATPLCGAPSQDHQDDGCVRLSFEVRCRFA